MSKAPLKAVSSTWRRLMVDQDGNISRAAYTLCILQQLQDNLRRKDIFVPESDRWSDPRKKLLRGAEWDSKRSQLCRSLSLPKGGDKALKDLEQQLDQLRKEMVELKTGTTAALKPAPERKCYRCGQAGHFANKCRTNPDAARPPRDDNRCFRCHRSGHQARACTTGPPKKPCFVCHGPHWAFDCPQRNADAPAPASPALN